jgi:hypothetical protein
MADSGKHKKTRGQFYTTNSSYILDGFPLPPSDVRCIVEPFAGKGDLMDWLRKSGCTTPIEAYDIEPKGPSIEARDTLTYPPNYQNTWILTNPPYFARNKSAKKEIYDQYDTNDLYKCFLSSVVAQNNCRGGIFIIPAGFFFSPRAIDVRCRDAFMKRFRITKVKYFEESVFSDTTTTIADATEWTLEVYGAFQPPRVTWATHTNRFVAAVENGPLSATQFHPERSGDAGARLLRNWLNTL